MARHVRLHSLLRKRARVVGVSCRGAPQGVAFFLSKRGASHCVRPASPEGRELRRRGGHPAGAAVSARGIRSARPLSPLSVACRDHSLLRKRARVVGVSCRGTPQGVAFFLSKRGASHCVRPASPEDRELRRRGGHPAGAAVSARGIRSARPLSPLSAACRAHSLLRKRARVVGVSCPGTPQGVAFFLSKHGGVGAGGARRGRRGGVGAGGARRGRSGGSGRGRSGGVGAGGARRGRRELAAVRGVARTNQALRWSGIGRGSRGTAGIMPRLASNRSSPADWTAKQSQPAPPGPNRSNVTREPVALAS